MLPDITKNCDVVEFLIGSTGFMLLELGQRLNKIVDLRISPEAEGRFQKEIKAGGVPILYANHQSHADGIALAVAAEYLLGLAREAEHTCLKGFAVPVAKSLSDGRQSRVLQAFYYPISWIASRKGLESIAVTRRKDKERYGMDRSGMVKEARPFANKIRAGYGIALFPEGSVQGGRHSEGSDREDIFGMQDVADNALLRFYELVDRFSGEDKRPFFAPLGLHGGFRFQDPTNLLPTREGLVALFGIPTFGRVSSVRFEATLGMPVTIEKLQQEFGPNWINAQPLVNSFLMRSVAALVPIEARGIYANDLQVLNS